MIGSAIPQMQKIFECYDRMADEFRYTCKSIDKTRQGDPEMESTKQRGLATLEAIAAGLEEINDVVGSIYQCWQDPRWHPDTDTPF